MLAPLNDNSRLDQNLERRTKILIF